MMKDPLTMAVARQSGKRQSPVRVQDNRALRRRRQGRKARSADAGNLHKVRLPSDWPSSPQPPSWLLGSTHGGHDNAVFIVRWYGAAIAAIALEVVEVGALLHSLCTSAPREVGRPDWGGTKHSSERCMGGRNQKKIDNMW